MSYCSEAVIAYARVDEPMARVTKAAHKIVLVRGIDC